MNASEKVAFYLGVQAKSVKVQEWAKVYWVCLNGHRPTLLSKKLVDRASRINVSCTIAGDGMALDTATGRAFIFRAPGHYGNGLWSVKEIKPNQINIWNDFSDFSEKSENIKFTHKPGTVRELMVHKFVCNKWFL